jgi:hypothetical protein
MTGYLLAAVVVAGVRAGVVDVRNAHPAACPGTSNASAPAVPERHGEIPDPPALDRVAIEALR